MESEVGKILMTFGFCIMEFLCKFPAICVRVHMFIYVEIDTFAELLYFSRTI